MESISQGALEFVCIPKKTESVILRAVIDTAIVFALLYLIAFIGDIIEDFTGSFAYVFANKKPLFFVLIVLSVSLTVFFRIAEDLATCRKIEIIEDTLILTKKKKRESIRIENLNVTAGQSNKGVVRLAFRQGKAASYADFDTVTAKKIEEILIGNGARCVKDKKRR